MWPIFRGRQDEVDGAGGLGDRGDGREWGSHHGMLWESDGRERSVRSARQLMPLARLGICRSDASVIDDRSNDLFVLSTKGEEQLTQSDALIMKRVIVRTRKIVPWSDRPSKM